MSALQVSHFIYLLGFCLLFNGVLSNPNLRILSKDLVQEQVSGQAISQGDDEFRDGEKFRVNISPMKGYTGFRGVFQWTFGKRNFDNYGLQNAMKFSTHELLNASMEIIGNIGIYSNGSQIGVHFSYESGFNSIAGPMFDCARNFPLEMRNLGCFNSSYSLVSNAIYFMDVEIHNKSIKGYISEPQTSFNGIYNSSLPRILIGEIKWHKTLTNLNPMRYWFANDYKSCNLSTEISSLNYLPEFYNNQTRTKAYLYNSVMNLKSMCGPINAFGKTDWATTLYISRPSPVLN